MVASHQTRQGARRPALRGVQRQAGKTQNGLKRRSSPFPHSGKPRPLYASRHLMGRRRWRCCIGNATTVSLPGAWDPSLDHRAAKACGSPLNPSAELDASCCAVIGSGESTSMAHLPDERRFTHLPPRTMSLGRPAVARELSLDRYAAMGLGSPPYAPPLLLEISAAARGFTSDVKRRDTSSLAHLWHVTQWCKPSAPYRHTET